MKLGSQLPVKTLPSEVKPLLAETLSVSKVATETLPTKTEQAWKIFAQTSSDKVSDAKDGRGVQLQLAGAHKSYAKRRVETQLTELIRKHPSMAAAWVTVVQNLGDLGDDQKETTARLGSARGLVHGAQSADGRRGWRLDFDPEKGPHFNWYDWSKGKRGAGGRWAAEMFPGNEQGYLEALMQLQERSASTGPIL